MGFEKELGICKCKQEDLEDICDRECRLKQKDTLVLVCKNPPVIQVNSRSGSVNAVNTSLI